jgi:hypothetical protein
MDLVRSCYKRRMRYVAGDPSQSVIATWYFAAKTAIPFPGVHRFGSGNLDTVQPSPSLLGDQSTSSRAYYNGRRLNSSPGRDFAGPKDDFLFGAPAPGQLPRGADGYTPVECFLPPFGLAKGGLSVPTNPNMGGKYLSGKSITYITPGSPCSFCTGVTPLRVKIVVTGCTGAGVPINGTWILTQVSSCTWALNASPSLIFNALRTSPGWTVGVSLVPPGVIGSWGQAVPSFDCLSQFTCFKEFPFPAALGPSITIEAI